MFSDCPKITIEISANGSVSGSDSRIVTGCSHDSNCAARIRYMNTSDRTIAERNAVAVRLSSRERPVKPARYSGVMLSVCARSAICCCTRGLRRARQHVGDDRHLPLPGDAADRRRRRVLLEGRDVVEADAAEARRGHRQRRDRRLGRAILFTRAQVHLVLLAAVVERRHRVAADEQAQRFGRVADRDAEVGGLRSIDVHRQLGLAEVQRGVDVDEAGNLPPTLSRSALL